MESSIPSSNQKISRRLIGSVFGMVFLIGIVCAYGHALDWHRRQRSLDLIRDVEQLRVGQTSEAEIQRLSVKYGGHSVAQRLENPDNSFQPPYYLVSVQSPSVKLAESVHALPGQRLWGVSAYLPVENGYLSSITFDLGLFRADGLILNPEVVLSGNERLLAPDEVSYFVYQPVVSGPPTEMIKVELRPNATADERKKAFDFNFSCLTQFRECRHVCELMPNAWKDLPPERRTHYGDGREKVTDSECLDRLN
jgi:hypothetical protein